MTKSLSTGGETMSINRYIEVKSTKLTKEAPFYFSALEHDFSRRNRSNFFLYRVFNLKAEPKLFIAKGAYDEFCNASPTQSKVHFDDKSASLLEGNGISTLICYNEG